MPHSLPDGPSAIFPANDEPQRVEPGVWRLSVPLPFALRQANIYLLDNGDGSWTLVDSGLGLPADEAALRAGMARAGVTFAQLSALILTHAHPDHIGLSGLVQAAADVPVYLLAGEEAALYLVWSSVAGVAMDAVTAMYAGHGLPADEAEAGSAATRRVRKLLRLPRRETLRLLEDGAELRLGAHTYSVIWTPGHSDYHMCLLREDGLFIAGDHILPSITPNIGVYPGGRPDPLRDYYSSLARVRDLPARLVLPGHRRPFADLAGRVDALRAHHEERGATLLALVRMHRDGTDAATLASALFGARLRTTDDRRFALVETVAHLEYLRGEGQVERMERDGHITYAAVAQG